MCKPDDPVSKDVAALVALFEQHMRAVTEQLEEHHAESIDVGGGLERLRADLLGGHVAGRAALLLEAHAVRLIWGADHRFLLPLSVLTGAIFMILADLAARTVLAPTEIPIGVITALCGAPFFLYLLRRRRRVIF